MSQMRDSNKKIVSDPKTKRTRVFTINKEPSKTQQQFKDECDINNIMAKYATTGEFLHKTSKLGAYADFSSITDYREMLDTVIYANDAFASLPAETRKRFDNDPHNLLNFVQDSKNYDEGVRLGLIHPKQIEPQTQNQIPNQIPNTEPKKP